jgi:stage V sporulation protein G
LGEARGMEITDVRIRLVNNRDDRLRAFCTVTLDHEFVVRDIKVIEGTSGYFVAMPSRKISDYCPECRGKNHFGAKFCNNCGAPQTQTRTKTDPQGRPKLHADIAHPINGKCRQNIQEKVVAAFEEEVRKSRQPGYKPVWMDEPDDEIPEMIS